MRPTNRGAVAVLLVLIALALAPTLSAQTPAKPPRDSVKVAIIRDLIAQTHAVDQALAAMETALPSQRAANPNIPPIFWDRFLAEARARRTDLEDLLVDVYERHFEADELRQLSSFYKTSIGQKLLATLPAVMQESMLAGQEWGRRLGAAVAEKLAAEGVKIPPT